MRWRCICFVSAAMTLSLGGAAEATAQTPASYNSARAYSHFLGSRYSYRTMYSSIPGSRSVTYSPFFAQSQFIEPAFSKQWITPYYYERFDAFPGFGGTRMTPFSFGSYYYPGFGYGLYAPYGGPMIEYYYP